MAADGSLTLLLVARIPRDGVAGFQAYEDGVLPLLTEHGGRLERRLRNADGTIEMHIVRFESRAAFDGYRADPRRAALQPMLAATGAAAETYELFDVN